MFYKIFSKRPPLETAKKIYWHGTAQLRVLPDFLITGVAKGGTETLWATFKQHPQIIQPNRHSIHYFDEAINKPIKWYQAHFPLRASMPKGCITGEKSTYYFSHPLAAERIAKHLPDVKLIILLRNPVDRAISQYFHYHKRGHENLPIEDALKQEEKRLAPYLADICENSVYKPGHPMKVFSYKTRGHYAEQLEKYFKYFDPNQIKIVKSENFFLKPRETLQAIFEFLGIDPAVDIQNLEPRNVGERNRRVPRIVYESLEKYYLPYNKKLQVMLGEEFTWSQQINSD